MQLEKATLHIFKQLEDVISGINAGHYNQPLEILYGATIGQHVRHSLEMFICLNTGYPLNEVNYDARRRDKAIEENKDTALNVIHKLGLELNKPDKQLRVLSTGWVEDGKAESYATTYCRELVYCMEHAVHHMAIIKIGLKAAAPQLQLPDGFGVAASTLKYKKNVYGNLPSA